MNDLSKLIQKTAAKAKKKKKSRQNMMKDLDSNKKVYQDAKKKLSDLESKKAKLEEDIAECREVMRGSRSDMLQLTDVLKNMDLADCNYASFYENDAKDIAYVIDGGEFHIELDDAGDLVLKPMKEHQLDRRRKQKEEAAVVEPEEYEEVLEEEIPNFRFVD